MFRSQITYACNQCSFHVLLMVYKWQYAGKSQTLRKSMYIKYYVFQYFVGTSDTLFNCSKWHACRLTCTDKFPNVPTNPLRKSALLGCWILFEGEQVPPAPPPPPPIGFCQLLNFNIFGKFTKDNALVYNLFFPLNLTTLSIVVCFPLGCQGFFDFLFMITLYLNYDYEVIKKGGGKQIQLHEATFSLKLLTVMRILKILLLQLWASP